MQQLTRNFLPRRYAERTNDSSTSLLEFNSPLLLLSSRLIITSHPINDARGGGGIIAAHRVSFSRPKPSECRSGIASLDEASSGITTTNKNKIGVERERSGNGFVIISLPLSRKYRGKAGLVSPGKNILPDGEVVGRNFSRESWTINTEFANHNPSL